MYLPFPLKGLFSLKVFIPSREFTPSSISQRLQSKAADGSSQREIHNNFFLVNPSTRENQTAHALPPPYLLIRFSKVF